MQVPLQQPQHMTSPGLDFPSRISLCYYEDAVLEFVLLSQSRV